MKTTPQLPAHLRHPEDLMREFWGRLSAFNALGIAVLERTSGGSNSEVCSQGLAQGLCMLHQDYEELERQVHTWIEVHVKGGA
jgi:hypothetical protein